MNNKYQIRLTARNEGIEYRDETMLLRFNVSLRNGTWHIYLPCSRGDKYETYQLTAAEYEKVIPRIKDYLSAIKWFGFFKKKYSVEVVNKS
jgi:hypothetical protein